jgi:hypothetical protein
MKTTKQPLSYASAPTIKTPTVPPTPEAIRLRAYLIFLARGGSGGSEFEDWLKAENELKQEYAKKIGS